MLLYSINDTWEEMVSPVRPRARVQNHSFVDRDPDEKRIRHEATSCRVSIRVAAAVSTEPTLNEMNYATMTLVLTFDNQTLPKLERAHGPAVLELTSGGRIQLNERLYLQRPNGRIRSRHGHCPIAWTHRGEAVGRSYSGWRLWLS
jgi:hypothetical protein